MSFNDAFKTISQLVKDFKENEKHFLNTSYSEADVRNDFINKFFIALGWDVRHEIQKNPYEQEVRVEKPVLIAKAQKRADYTFYLSPNFRDVKFFVEAKKPYHDLESKDYFFQTVRYGWNANTPVAVLTDFEEFIILDCRYKPDISNVLQTKIKKFHYSDYAKEEKLKEIYFLFSREAVADNSIEKYAASLPKPKGKVVQRGLFKGGFQPIDESFLEEIDEIRTSLAKSFKKNNSHLTSEELTEATQRTIDRLVFIKFLEDKLIEPDHYISSFGDRKTVWEDFLSASRTLDAKYNGVVFKKSLIDTRNIVEPDEKTFSQICEDLSHENTPYDFDKIPIHILGSIYERFLGKVVNATDKRVTIEEKPEVRKAGGVYYTPQYIVNYIVDNTVVKLIEGKTPKEIAKLKFADIACGSGSFLITVYERLIDYHKQYYQQHPEQAKKDGCIMFEGAYRLTLKQKQKILLNNIYGVDLDQQAVEVTQLSLYLKLLEDETTATANDTWVMFKEKLLPDLNKNIVCGNSLIGTDILNNQTSLPLGGIEGGVNELKLKPMDFENVFPDVMKGGGFDAIVGNPPYVSIEFMVKDIGEYFLNNYKTAYGRVNSFSLFFERYLAKAKKGALCGFIISNRLYTNTQLEKLREMLLKETSIQSILSFKKAVFKAAVDTSVLVFKNNLAERSNNILVLNNIVNLEQKVFEKKIIPQEIYLKTPNYLINLDINPLNTKLLSSIEERSYHLENICDIKDGIILGSIKELFLSDTAHDSRYKKFLDGNCVTKYSINWDSKYICYDKDLINKELELKKKMFKKTSTVKETKKKQRSGVWLRDPLVFEQEKIITRQNAKRIIGTLDEDRYYVKNSLHNILKKKEDYNLKFILAILNSSLMDFYFQNRIGKTGEIFSQMKIEYLKKLPIIKIDFAKGEFKSGIEKIISLVDQILTAKKQLQQAKTESDKNYLERKCETLDRQIDALVYELYGLTDEEIGIVEGG